MEPGVATPHEKAKEPSNGGEREKSHIGLRAVWNISTGGELPSIQDAGQPNPPHLIAHRSPFRALREPAPPFSASDPRFKYFPAWLAQKDATGDLKAFEAPLCRKLFEVDFFSRAAAKGLLPPAAHKWNLGALAYFILFTQQRLTIKTGAGGSEVYGNLKDGADAIHEIERICDWLMDPIACPTSWPVLLKIRTENPLYAQTRQPTTA